MRARESNLPSVSAPPRRAPPKTGANIDPDDDAETRLYRPHLTIPRPNAMTGQTTVPERASLSISGAPRSSPVPRSAPPRSSPRPSTSNHPVTRSGPLFHVPDSLPSVRVRSDSDSELGWMESHRPPAELDDDDDYEAPGLVAQHSRELTLSTRLLMAAVIVATILLVAHEASLSFHLPWLDPRRLLVKLLAWRHR
jgi:hypothetical protein